MKRALAALPVGLALAVLAGPAPAWADHHIVAPGDPGSAQYQEDVPTASGSRPVSTLQPSSATPAASVLPRATVHALSKDGAAGRSTVALAQATTSSPTPSSTSRSVKAQPLSYRAAGPVAVLTRSLLGSGGGIGVLLPILLVLSLGSALVAAIGRRRS